MKKPELQIDNVPTEAGRYYMHRSPGFGSTPEWVTVREGEDGLEYKSDNGVEWAPLSRFWNTQEWLFSDKQ